MLFVTIWQKNLSTLYKEANYCYSNIYGNIIIYLYKVAYILYIGKS